MISQFRSRRPSVSWISKDLGWWNDQVESKTWLHQGVLLFAFVSKVKKKTCKFFFVQPQGRTQHCTPTCAKVRQFLTVCQEICHPQQPYCLAFLYTIVSKDSISNDSFLLTQNGPVTQCAVGCEHLAFADTKTKLKGVKRCIERELKEPRWVKTARTPCMAAWRSLDKTPWDLY